MKKILIFVLLKFSLMFPNINFEKTLNEYNKFGCSYVLNGNRLFKIKNFGSSNEKCILIDTKTKLEKELAQDTDCMCQSDFAANLPACGLSGLFAANVKNLGHQCCFGSLFCCFSLWVAKTCFEEVKYFSKKRELKQSIIEQSSYLIPEHQHME